MKIKHLFYFVPIVLLAGCAHGTFVAKGIVVDKNNRPVSGVDIVTGPYSETVHTDSAGQFQVSVFEAGLRLKGKARISFQKAGYKTKKKSVKKESWNIIKLKLD
jgi:hypothetical protein